MKRNLLLTSVSSRAILMAVLCNVDGLSDQLLALGLLKELPRKKWKLVCDPYNWVQAQTVLKSLGDHHQIS